VNREMLYAAIAQMWQGPPRPPEEYTALSSHSSKRAPAGGFVSGVAKQRISLDRPRVY
jgi:hypothetical protein